MLPSSLMVKLVLVKPILCSVLIGMRI